MLTLETLTAWADDIQALCDTLTEDLPMDGWQARVYAEAVHQPDGAWTYDGWTWQQWNAEADRYRAIWHQDRQAHTVAKESMFKALDIADALVLLCGHIRQV